MKKVLLFFAHSVTFAHVARPLRWIESLDFEKYQIYVAADRSYRALIESRGLDFIECPSITHEIFAKRVNRALPIYDSVTFEDHVQHDLQIMDRVSPDLVVGDFRHSLSVSCRLAGITYLNMCNAYWSLARKRSFPLPETPLIRLLGQRFASRLGPLVQFGIKFNFVWLALKLRRSFSRANLKLNDYRDVITDGDYVAFFDLSEVVPLKRQKPNEFFLGPMVWSVTAQKPPWWNELRPSAKRVWVNLGSSGDYAVLPMLLSVLSEFDLDILLTLSGNSFDVARYPRVFVADLLPADAACHAVDFVICNGGSPATSNALALAKPVIGIVNNNDQLLNISIIVDNGAGIALRYWDLNDAALRAAVTRCLTSVDMKEAALRMADLFKTYDVSKRIREITERALRTSKRPKKNALTIRETR